MALLLRKILIHFVTPATGFLQRVHLSTHDEVRDDSRGYWLRKKHKLFTYPLRFLNWGLQGMLALAYPSMKYNPIAFRQQAAASQWASELLKVPSSALEKIAFDFLDDVSPSLFSKKESAPTFTILICFYHHFDFFKKCLESVSAACQQAPEDFVEVLVVNDDPTITTEYLSSAVPEELREKVSFLSNKENLGICRSLNAGIKQARGSWIVYLDCDDLLMPSAFEALRQAIQKRPTARFISSRVLDIDEEDHVLLWRLRLEKPRDLLKNNVASHLKAMRKDLHEAIGLFNRDFEGCQDYEFALRAAVCETLYFIPDYLYQYRWHDKSQTVDQNARQNLTALRIRQTYLLAIFWMKYGTKNISWKIIGPYAASWKGPLMKIENHSCHTHSQKALCEVTLTALQPYSEIRRKLLLIEVATACIDQYRKEHREITLSVHTPSLV